MVECGSNSTLVIMENLSHIILIPNLKLYQTERAGGQGRADHFRVTLQLYLKNNQPAELVMTIGLKRDSDVKN